MPRSDGRVVRLGGVVRGRRRPGKCDYFVQPDGRSFCLASSQHRRQERRLWRGRWHLLGPDRGIVPVRIALRRSRHLGERAYGDPSGRWRVGVADGQCRRLIDVLQSQRMFWWPEPRVMCIGVIMCRGRRQSERDHVHQPDGRSWRLEGHAGPAARRVWSSGSFWRLVRFVVAVRCGRPGRRRVRVHRPGRWPPCVAPHQRRRQRFRSLPDRRVVRAKNLALRCLRLRR